MYRWRTVLLVILAAMLMTNRNIGSHQSDQTAAPENSSDAGPVEDDMHEFMEYVFQPTYRRLKSQMAKSPKDKQVWKAIKSDALILAEGGNLLLLRKPPKDADDWKGYSLAVRASGSRLYDAGRKQDAAVASKHYRSMLENCNACHKQFAKGRYQLKP